MSTTRTYLEETSNRNVPPNVLLIAEEYYPEQNITYYIDREGWIWKVGDWVTDKPHKINKAQACRVTGDTENMLDWRWAQWVNEQG